MSMLSKFKKSNCSLTNDEVKSIEYEILDIQNKCFSITSKSNKTKKDIEDLCKYGKRLYHLKKVLTHAKKYSI